ncbi:MAG: leucine-rich repeat domain-containing protein [Ruminococcus sp.]|uniref:leucine-rich repeat domain-containing protein n=1 Tax=Ruminococcus sp. TaxID=41978 RepID=UPI0025FC5B4E|nr:leucine-rich repeat domain-containing protein [Ruminococcus sp.]MCR5541462.1 leucine-rich repeat domain-containing protein [Ruminococcus sp.]
MKSKKIISGMLALTLIFGGAVLPCGLSDDFTVISASAEKCGSFWYTELDDGTVSIIDYYNFDNETDLVIPSELDGKTVSEIGTYVFGRTNSKITSVTIPDTVHSIGSKAFAYCSDLKKVNLSKNLKSIGSYAFRNCKSLENITLPEGLETIEEYAFLYCDNLKSIEIPASLKNIGASAFHENIKLESITFAEHGSLLNIDRYAFYGCNSLKELNLPDYIVHIGENAFCDCKSLKSVSLLGSSTKVDYGAFAHNPALESVTIAQNTKVISEFEFGMCENLKEIIIPKSVEEIGEGAFRSCGKDFVIYCYEDSFAHEYAIKNNLNYHLIDGKEPDCLPRTRIIVEYNEQYHQVKFTWDKVYGADRYGIAVYLAGKWKVQDQEITSTSYTTPKSLTPSKTYKVAIAARVNGKWDTANAIKNAVTVTIK